MKTRVRIVTTTIVLALALVALAATAQASPLGRAASHHQETLPPIEMGEAENCDFIADPGDAMCMLPFPDNYYTVSDPSSETGLRVHFDQAGMPANVLGQHIEPGAWNESDGFSPGSVILVKIPGIETAADVTAMHGVPIGHIGHYAHGAGVVVLDANTGQLWPIWTEIDSTASNPGKRVLEIHPAVNFKSGDRYIVAIRNVKNAADEHIEAPAAFRYYRDDVPSEQPQIEARRAHYEELFSKLEAVGVKRKSLYLSWDFTVASDMNNAGRVLSMRNQAFAEIGDEDLADGIPEGVSPSFTVTKVVENPNPGQVARRVEGTFQVPCFLFPNCGPGGRMHLDSEGNPIQNGSWTANFECIIPDSVVTGPGEEGRPSLYGHGLLGSSNEVASSPQRSLSEEHKIVQCATDEIGMAESDVGVVIASLENASHFPAVADRLQQGLLDELFLGRMLISPSGLTTAAAFHQDGTLSTPSVLNTSHLFYNGNSQGGIMGGALTAISPDFTRASLGVPAMNYSVLLPRSVDFDEFAQVFYPYYPSETERPLVLDLMQMLWDRGEPDGYAERMTSDPLPDTPAHQVLLDVALGDHQVTDYQAEVEARTIGAEGHEPALYKGRWPGMNVLWDVPAISSYPYTGSAIYYWDIGPVRPNPANPSSSIGVEPPPFENIPNSGGEDPHSSPRAAPAEQQLVSDFFNGSVLSSDRCGRKPCYSGVFTGP
jgi:hypothetical protein